MKVDMGVLWAQATEDGNHQNLEKAKNRFSSRNSGGSVALPIPWFQASSLQNDERINFC